MEAIEENEDYVGGGILVILYKDLRHLASGADKYDSRESQSLVKTAIDTALKVDLEENVGFRTLLRDIFSKYPITKQQMETLQECSTEKSLYFMLDFATYIEDLWNSIDRPKLQAMINIGNQIIEVMSCRRKSQFERLRMWLLQLDDGEDENLTNLLQFNGSLIGYLYGPNNQWNSGRPSAYQMLSMTSGSHTEFDLDSIDLSSSWSANQRPRTVSVSSSFTQSATESKMLTFFDLKNKREHFDQNACLNAFLDWFRSGSISTEELGSKNLQVEAISSYFAASMKEFKRIKEVNLVFMDRVLSFAYVLRPQISVAQKVQMNLLMDQKLRLLDRKTEALQCSLKMLLLLERDWSCVVDCIEGNVKVIQNQPKTALTFILFMWRNRKDERLKSFWRLLCFCVAVHSRSIISYASEITSELVKILEPVEVISSLLDITAIAAGFELTLGNLLQPANDSETAASQIDQEKITQVMERYRTVIALEEETRGETFPDEDPLARYGISKPIETTIGHLENNDRITVATDCACLLMKVFLFAQQPALTFHTLKVLLFRVQNFQIPSTHNCYREKFVKCLTTNLKQLKVDWNVKNPRHYFDTIETLRGMFNDANSGQLPIAVVLFMTNSLDPENPQGSFKECRSTLNLQHHYVNNFFTFLDTTVREALRNEYQTTKEKMIGLLFCLHHMALVDESLRNSVLLCFNTIAQMNAFVKIPQFEQIRAKAVELMASIWQKQTRKVFSAPPETADIFHRIDKLGLI